MKQRLVAACFAGSLFLASCGNSDISTSETATGNEVNNNIPVSNTITITADDQMKFNKIELRIKANEKVTLTLKNIGKMPKETMGHNLVVLKDEVDLANFAAKANNALPDYVPENMKAVVIAHTKVLGPGESQTIEFTVPKGSYTYICSFPGHYMNMMGILTAE